MSWIIAAWCSLTVCVTVVFTYNALMHYQQEEARLMEKKRDINEYSRD